MSWRGITIGIMDVEKLRTLAGQMRAEGQNAYAEQLEQALADEPKHRIVRGNQNPSCQHHRIDNATARCLACNEQMISVAHEAETILSAPNAAACTNPACEEALADGTYDETNPPAGCTNPHGNYIPDRSRERRITLGYNVTYDCDRCSNNGTIMDHKGITWECGKSHHGDYIYIRAEANAAAR